MFAAGHAQIIDAHCHPHQLHRVLRDPTRGSNLAEAIVRMVQATTAPRDTRSGTVGGFPRFVPASSQLPLFFVSASSSALTIL